MNGLAGPIHVVHLGDRIGEIIAQAQLTFSAGGGETLNVWIDTESFLVRQVKFQNRLSAGETRSTLRYQPEINVQIPASVISAEPDPGELSPPEALLELLSFERAEP